MATHRLPQTSLAFTSCVSTDLSQLCFQSLTPHEEWWPRRASCRGCGPGRGKKTFQGSTARRPAAPVAVSSHLEASQWAEACGGRARSSPGRSRRAGAGTVSGQRRLRQPGVAGVPSLPARRSPGRGGCRSPSRRARPRSFPAPAAAEGLRAWRGSGGARGGRLHRVAPPAVPRLPPGPRACHGRCPDRGRSCRVGRVPRSGRGLRSPGGARVHRLRTPVPGGTRLGAPPSRPCSSSPHEPPPTPPSTHPRGCAPPRRAAEATAPRNACAGSPSPGPEEPAPPPYDCGFEKHRTPLLFL
ncbi:leucine-rich repeat extensin-like protein 5 [Ailuropoda melanoleuca]|uniref:leucine-rich repeat extensin-like protein 5 n=1 Tax=Ailuropoda melanoleuca TaxID=9646 RepID=UPI0014940538|nr:leucine-rich repeat extensin-like protein 5 [Ailuropoda melanoleuca]